MSENLRNLVGLMFLMAFFSTNLNAQCEGGRVYTGSSPNELAFACVNDGDSDYIKFSNNENKSEEYVFLTTDTNNIILVINSGNYVNFENAGIGVCRVWGCAYDGDFQGNVGDNAATTMLASECYELSENFLTIDRSEVETTSISTDDDEKVVDINDNAEAKLTFKNNSTGTAKYIYVITKSNNLIIDFTYEDNYDFSYLEEGKYFVWGFSFSGDLVREIDDKLRRTFSEGCFKRSSNDIVVRKHTEALPPDVCIADAGTLTSDASSLNLVGGTATLTATSNGDAVVPENYEVVYVLTEGPDLVISRLSPVAFFNVTETGNYTIHTFIVEISDLSSENFFDAAGVMLNITTGGEVLAMIEAQGVCASLDAVGASTEVLPEIICNAAAGVLMANPDVVVQQLFTIIEAGLFFDPMVPVGYDVSYVLSLDGVILQTSDTPVFVVDNQGIYTIQMLVAETSDMVSMNYFDLSSIVLGMTTVDEFTAELEASGVCAAFDTFGAQITVIGTSTVRSSEEDTDETKLVLTNEFTIFPNPVIADLNVRLNLREVGQIMDANLVVTNIQGQVIHQQIVDIQEGQNEFRISVATLARGMYQIQVYNKEQQWVERFYKH